MALLDRSRGRHSSPKPDCKIATFDIGLLFPGFDLDVQILAGFPLDLQPHRVVLVRFARAVSGFADASAPDIDDHGYTVCPGGPTQGPTVGVTSRALIRVKVMRDRIADDTDLFVTIDDASVAAIEFPAAGTALSVQDIPADATNPARQADCVFIRGGASGSSRSTTLSVHVDSAAGPVVAKLTVFQHPLIVIPMQLHRVTINTLAPTVGDDHVFRVVAEANKILAQAGIRIQPRSQVLPESVGGFKIEGTVDEDSNEATIVFNTNPQPAVLNAYFFLNFTLATKGLANTPRIAANAKTGFLFCTDFRNGVTIDEQTAGHTMAHELGHVLGLEHFGNGQEEQQNDTTRQDIWAHRSIMFNRVVIEADRPRSSVERVKVGYGARRNGDLRAGGLLSSKQRDGIPKSGEIATMRDGASRNVFFP